MILRRHNIDSHLKLINFMASVCLILSHKICHTIDAVGRPLGRQRSLHFLSCKYYPGVSYLYFTSNFFIIKLLLLHYEMRFLSNIDVI